MVSVSFVGKSSLFQCSNYSLHSGSLALMLWNSITCAIDVRSPTWTDMPSLVHPGLPKHRAPHGRLAIVLGGSADALAAHGPPSSCSYAASCDLRLGQLLVVAAAEQHERSMMNFLRRFFENGLAATLT